MKTLVIYDISDDSKRMEISKTCEYFGLSRIQKSAFLGYLTSTRRKELRARVEELMKGYSGNIQIFVFCRYCGEFREVIGEGGLEVEKPSVIVC